ncbi:putative membrane protein YkoI [Streptosporangium becharense]|uniref:Putative membrane protein YkoI n=1 Tax=Streptosporangium becharense TaxID=1816182 RepID=A0A7W9IJH9_9ACTN|nr:PepSY domain-containing protein [Streptosporangium becharense]MBB2911092.1 putative membrane protein YkoI [Streptosporangium becharense]MBB5821850.1 putative membrane protein YkoI [Streptosporangium becharense]
MRKTTKLTIATIGLLAAVTGGGAAAFAGDTSPTPTPVPSDASPTPEAGEAQAKIQRDAAIKIAQDKVPGARLVSAEFEDDDAPAAWEIELRQGDVEHDFDIDATTGAILKQDQETETGDDKNEADDDADDQNGQNGQAAQGGQDDRDDDVDDKNEADDNDADDDKNDADDKNDRDDD